MKAEERRKKIYDMLSVSKELPVQTISEYFKVSPMTIRRDLDHLEHSNLIKRSYGKAYITDSPLRQEFSFDYRSRENLDAKRKIAHTALSLLNNISSLYVDGSSTAAELLSILPSQRSYTIFTNSFQALKILSKIPNVTTFVIGGILGSDHNTFDDPSSITVAKQIYVDATVTSCSCFSKNGIFNDTLTGTQLRRTMINNSTYNILLADHSKANSQGLFLLNSWDPIHALVTDLPLAQDLLNVIQAANVQVYW